MKRKEILVVALGLLICAALASYISSCIASRSKPSIPGRADAQFAKVLASDQIRCSYLIYSPYFRKDPNTAKLSGIFHDIMEEVGKRSGLKIVWTEEVGYETIFAGLDSGRYDVFAGGLWPNSTRAKAGAFTVPVFYSVIKAWVRADETRFTDLEGVDNSQVRIACIDGAMEDIIAKSDFPAAKRVSLPQLSPFTQNLLNITSGKADITFAEPGIIREFLANNPNALKECAPGKPLRIFGNSLVIRRDAIELKNFLDVALQELLYSGAVDKILQRYEPSPGVFPRAILPYRPETAILRSSLNVTNEARK